VQTSLPEAFRDSDDGRRAESILRSCVHCGFCNATCPTYQLLGDELDGPRGRIYLIKEMLEEEHVSPVTVRHLDRCLTCRSCETTCPSGVAYGELLEIGRNYQESRYRRTWVDGFIRNWLVRVVPDFRAFRRWSRLGSIARPFLPRQLRNQLPRPPKLRKPASVSTAAADPSGKVLLLDGCAQRVSTPGVNDALEALLTSLGIEVVRHADEGCCGSLALHLGRQADALNAMRYNLDVLGDLVGEVDAVVSTASGCGVTLKDYRRLLNQDADAASAAALFSDKVMDVGEYLSGLDVTWRRSTGYQRVAFHAPCTLQHGQRSAEAPGTVLQQAGYDLVQVADAHLCCGSAGTYSLLESDLAEALGREKAAALTVDEPEVIATANVGCQVHIGTMADPPVVHWIELLAGEVR
jgi:glycolate oxidase iron-sulfur subunit